MYLDEGDYGYEKHYVQVPDMTGQEYRGEMDGLSPKDIKDYQNWLDKLPKVWQLNPFHNHFIYVEPETSDEEIMAQMQLHLPNFYAAWCQGWGEVKGGMRHGWAVKTRIRPKRYDKLESPEEHLLRKTRCETRVVAIKSFLAQIQTNEKGETFPATEILIGPGATERGTTGYGNFSVVDLANPANDTGTIDTFELWFSGVAITGVKVGTLQNTGGTNFNPRDHEVIGNVAEGSKQTFSGKDCAVVAGDYIGFYSATGTIYLDLAGGSGNHRIAGDQWGAGDIDWGALQADRAISIYGTGNTPAVDHTKELADTVTLADTITTKAIGVFKTESAFPLAGWAKRVKLIIDQNDIDAALSNFPILVYLSTSSGRNGDDVSCIFDELTSDGNRKKIAVTTSDEETECYVEIEKWDDANEQAWLWVKVPSVASDADTELYLYYDSTHADNDTYVGDPSDAVVHNVWDSNFKLVSHMRDGADTSHIYDSTSNDNDGTKRDAAEPAITTSGKISDAQDFDGANDYIGLARNFMATPTDLTMEVWFKTAMAGAGVLVDVEGAYVMIVGWKTVGKIAAIADGSSANYVESGVVNDDGWHHVVLVNDGSLSTLYIDGGSVDTAAETLYDIDTLARVSAIGAIWGAPGNWFNGLLDEVRISSTDRSAAWIKASYESERDDLLDFGSEESRIGFVITDTITTKTIGIFKTETVAIADIFSKVSTFIRTIADTVTITDSIAKTISIVRADTLAIADSISKTIGLFRTETIAIVDAIHAAMHWINLTLRSRSVALTLEPRSVALTLKSRSLNLTLRKRK